MPLMRKSLRRQRNAYVKAPSGKHGEKKISIPERTKFFERIKAVGGIKRIGAVVLLLMCAAGLSAFLCLISVRLYNTAVTSAFFQTKHVDVMGNVRLGKDMVLRCSGIREGENSLSVNIADAEKELRRTPWVEEVSIKRLLPDRFVIKLRERMPSFWIHKDGVLYYANERGDAIAPVESTNFLSLPTLLIEPGTEEVVPYLSRMLKDTQDGALPVESGVIAQVTVSAAGAI